MASPPPSLRERLAGAWQLESYAAHAVSPSTTPQTIYPMTKKAQGMIMYTPDGYMSAHLLAPGQQPFKRGEASNDQWAEAAKRYVAYAGPYYITQEEGKGEVLRHGMRVHIWPAMVGDVQARQWRFEEDGQVLILSSDEGTEIKGDLRRPELRWRRMPNNVHGVPPQRPEKFT